jgi:aspartyl-tRNA synthetase
MHRYRTHTCGALRESHIGETVRLSGWCHRIRDHGGVLFIDLRDHYGITQCVVDPDSPAFEAAEKLRSEWVVRMEGRVRRRPEGTDNPDLPTGAVELYVGDIEVLGPAAELPLPVFGEQEYPEDIRLKYRFLDLRREKLHHNIMTRGAIVDSMRRRMKEQGFFEFQTPILTASSPEGARDFLVPSRIHPGKFYALPQAPQQYKQLLMMSGFDRYFQIAPCFRDEDPRADRLPGEFYQLDVEMSFVTQEDVFAAMEPVITGVFEDFAKGKPVTKGWPRIPFAEALRKYGSDKPDLRNPIVMQDVSEAFRGSGFKVFARMLEDAKNQVWAIPAKTGGSRAFCDRMNSWAQGEGQPGLGYIMWREGGEGAGPLANNIGPERTAAIRTQLGLKEGDAAFFVAGDPDRFWKFAGLARTKLGEELNLIDKDRFELAWIVDFPMYEYNEEDKRIDFSHNPFSMPQGGLEALQTNDPLTIKAFQYDIACNGNEIASGGVRNHVPEAMVRAFEIAGYGEQEVVDRFGGMYRAFQYGAPPHGGMAAGLDRIVMLLCGTTNLREISLFPMNQQAMDLLMGAPSEATPKQLRELHIRINLPNKKFGSDDEAPICCSLGHPCARTHETSEFGLTDVGYLRQQCNCCATVGMTRWAAKMRNTRASRCFVHCKQTRALLDASGTSSLCR